MKQVTREGPQEIESEGDHTNRSGEREREEGMSENRNGGHASGGSENALKQEMTPTQSRKRNTVVFKPRQNRTRMPGSSRSLHLSPKPEPVLLEMDVK